MTVTELTKLIRNTADTERVRMRLEHLDRIEAALKGSGKQKEQWVREMEQILCEKRAVLLTQLKAMHASSTTLLSIIKNAPDAQTREILMQRCFDGRSWRSIAAAIGGVNGEDAIKKRVARYIKDLPSPFVY